MAPITLPVLYEIQVHAGAHTLNPTTGNLDYENVQDVLLDQGTADYDTLWASWDKMSIMIDEIQTPLQHRVFARLNRDGSNFEEWAHIYFIWDKDNPSTSMEIGLYCWEEIKDKLRRLNYKKIMGLSDELSKVRVLVKADYNPTGHGDPLDR